MFSCLPVVVALQRRAYLSHAHRFIASTSYAPSSHPAHTSATVSSAASPSAAVASTLPSSHPPPVAGVSSPARCRSFAPSSLLCHTRHMLTSLGHIDAIYCVAIDWTGRRIFTGSDDKVCKMWSADTGQLMHSMRGHMQEITDIVTTTEAQQQHTETTRRRMTCARMCVTMSCHVMSCHVMPCHDVGYLACGM